MMMLIIIQCDFKKKGNRVLLQIILKIEEKKDITKLISLHDSINYCSTLIWYVVHSYSAMDGCTAINFVKHIKIGFVQVGVICAA